MVIKAKKSLKSPNTELRPQYQYRRISIDQKYFINELNNEYVASDLENKFPHKKDKNK
jgi:hypothetical protein